MTLDLAELRRLADEATEGDKSDHWEPYFTTHGDPYVVEAGRGLFGTIATVSTDADDYGKARAAFIAAARSAVPALCDEVDRLRSALVVADNALGDIAPRAAAGFDAVHQALTVTRAAADTPADETHPTKGD